MWCRLTGMQVMKMGWSGHIIRSCWRCVAPRLGPPSLKTLAAYRAAVQCSRRHHCRPSSNVGSAASYCRDNHQAAAFRGLPWPGHCCFSAEAVADDVEAVAAAGVAAAAAVTADGDGSAAAAVDGADGAGGVEIAVFQHHCYHLMDVGTQLEHYKDPCSGQSPAYRPTEHLAAVASTDS